MTARKKKEGKHGSKGVLQEDEGSWPISREIDRGRFVGRDLQEFADLTVYFPTGLICRVTGRECRFSGGADR